MSASHVTTAPALAGDEPRLVKSSTLLLIAAIFGALTLVGLFVGDLQRLAFSWLIAVVFWTSVSIGALLLVLIHHIFDAGWSTVIRRPLEHWLAVFPWLGLLFAPLLLVSWFGTDHGLIWSWFDTHDPAIASDVLWVKKSGFLNPGAFTIFTIIFFGIWWLISWQLRSHSFAQDDDGSADHTRANRRTSAWGIPATALSLTFAAFYWMMSLEYHWFSTMYGVWFFATSVRGALSLVTLLALYLASRGVMRGMFSTAHMLTLGNLALAFVVFWAYICFSQYFLIWNANIPEETFWFHLREMNPSNNEFNSWRWVGMTLLFGYFVIPFLFFLQHPLKKKAGTMIFICLWTLGMQLLDVYYNILPALKLENHDPVPFSVTVWDVAALLTVGAVCFWAFFRSLPTARSIPIRDPRIVESLQAHE